MRAWSVQFVEPEGLGGQQSRRHEAALAEGQRDTLDHRRPPDPQGQLAAHLLGYVGEINDEEMDANPGEYELGDTIGKAGVEKVYEDDLRGVDGQQRIEVDAEGVPIRVLDRKPAVQGNDVVLSIDADLQRAAETWLDDQLRRQRRPTERDAPPAGGAIVAIDVDTGELLVAACAPRFDASVLVSGDPRVDRMLADPARPHLTRARLATEAVHEVGHLFGLVHCRRPGCAMARSSTTGEVDRKSGRLCPDCRVRLAEARPHVVEAS